MASSISQIVQLVNQIGQQASSTSAQLSQLATNLEKQVATVNSAIGGTSTGEDKTMIEAFIQASQAVKEAAGQLQEAAKAAKEWATKA